MKLLLILTALFLSGCVVAKTKDMVYVRIGSQKLDNVTVTEDPNGVKVTIGQQESDVQAALDTLLRAGLLGR